MFAAIAAALMLWELHRMVTGDRALSAPLLLALAGSAAASVLATVFFGIATAIGVIGVGAVAAAALAPRGRRAWLIGGLAYMALAMCFVTMLRDNEVRGLPVVVWLVLVVVAADIGGYFVGRVVGGPRLWPGGQSGQDLVGRARGARAARSSSAPPSASSAAGACRGWPC